MSINFKEKGQQLSVTHLTKGAITFTAEIDTKELFWKTLAKANAGTSKRAKELLEQALRATEELWVIGDITKTKDQGGAAYAAIPTSGGYVHVLVWDPSAEMTYDAAAKWVPKFKSTTEGTLKLTDRNAEKGKLGPEILLLHELGHFDQFLNRRDWYLERCAKQASSTTTPTEFTACQGDIEADNLSRNEWPVCTELGIHKRQTYWDDFGKVVTTENLAKFGITF